MILGEDCLGWVRAAGFYPVIADDGDVHLRSQKQPSTGYFIRRRGLERFELTQDDEDARSGRGLLFVAEVDVLEHYLVGHFADDIREDLDLPLLEQPWRSADLADGYDLTAAERGYRTLRRVGGVPVAAAPDDSLSLLALVPLSHYLGWSIRDLKQSFLSPAGSPLMRQGRYSRP